MFKASASDTPTKRATLREITETSQERAQARAMLLIRESCWFELTPMPDDCWHFTLKADAPREVFAPIS